MRDWAAGRRGRILGGCGFVRVEGIGSLLVHGTSGRRLLIQWHGRVSLRNAGRRGRLGPEPAHCEMQRFIQVVDVCDDDQNSNRRLQAAGDC